MNKKEASSIIALCRNEIGNCVLLHSKPDRTHELQDNGQRLRQTSI